MKKTITLTVIVAIIIFVLTGCGESSSYTSTSTSTSTYSYSKPTSQPIMSSAAKKYASAKNFKYGDNGFSFTGYMSNFSVANVEVDPSYVYTTGEARYYGIYSFSVLDDDNNVLGKFTVKDILDEDTINYYLMTSSQNAEFLFVFDNDGNMRSLPDVVQY